MGNRKSKPTRNDTQLTGRPEFIRDLDELRASLSDPLVNLYAFFTAKDGSRQVLSAREVLKSNPLEECIKNTLHDLAQNTLNVERLFPEPASGAKNARTYAGVIVCPPSNEQVFYAQTAWYEPSGSLALLTATFSREKAQSLTEIIKSPERIYNVAKNLFKSAFTLPQQRTFKRFLCEDNEFAGLLGLRELPKDELNRRPSSESQRDLLKRMMSMLGDDYMPKLQELARKLKNDSRVQVGTFGYSPDDNPLENIDDTTPAHSREEVMASPREYCALFTEVERIRTDKSAARIYVGKLSSSRNLLFYIKAVWREPNFEDAREPGFQHSSVTVFFEDSALQDYTALFKEPDIIIPVLHLVSPNRFNNPGFVVKLDPILSGRIAYQERVKKELDAILNPPSKEVDAVQQTSAVIRAKREAFASVKPSDAPTIIGDSTFAPQSPDSLDSKVFDPALILDQPYTSIVVYDNGKIVSAVRAPETPNLIALAERPDEFQLLFPEVLNNGKVKPYSAKALVARPPEGDGVYVKLCWQPENPEGPLSHSSIIAYVPEDRMGEAAPLLKNPEVLLKYFIRKFDTKKSGICNTLTCDEE